MSEGSYFIHKYESYINDKTLRFKNAFEAILFYYTVVRTNKGHLFSSKNTNCPLLVPTVPY